jgi:hypothetical protein
MEKEVILQVLAIVYISCEPYHWSPGLEGGKKLLDFLKDVIQSFPALIPSHEAPQMPFLEFPCFASLSSSLADELLITQQHRSLRDYQAQGQRH